MISNFIVGTAGHIDHGKTALVLALTGVDADRLPEEKRRGITIDIGFAKLDYAGAQFNFVDVPGHERFVKNMLAGAHGIDLVALVVAADAGVMPQTREHFEICRLLDVKFGVVVVTKIDLVDDEMLELVRLDVAELVENSFLESAPVVAVSARTGEGVENLKQVLLEIAREIPARADETVTRLPIDRAFSVKGFGAVVTGTLIAGTVAEGGEMELLPAQKPVRVRGVQTNNQNVQSARAGQRVAVNLGSIEAAEINRGDSLVAADALRATQVLDARVEVLADAPRALKSRQRVRVHIGTAEVLARVAVLNQANEIETGKTDFAQLRLESPVVAVPNQRFIVRSYSPQRTIAGGAIVDALAARHKRRNFGETREHLTNLFDAASRGDKTAIVRAFLDHSGERGATKADLIARTGWRADVLQPILDELAEKKAVIVAADNYSARAEFEKLTAKTVAAIRAHHKSEPLARGISRETLRERVFADLPVETFRRALNELETRGQIVVEKDFVRAAAHNLDLSKQDCELRDDLRRIYNQAKLEPPTLDSALSAAAATGKTTTAHARKIFQLLIDAGEVARVTPEFYFAQNSLAELILKLRAFAAANQPNALIDVAQFKDLAGVSRKYAIPLLEYFDREKVTRRAGDKRSILITNSVSKP